MVLFVHYWGNFLCYYWCLIKNILVYSYTNIAGLADQWTSGIRRSVCLCLTPKALRLQAYIAMPAFYIHTGDLNLGSCDCTANTLSTELSLQHKVTYFCILILYPTTLLSAFIRSMGFLVESLCSFMYRSIPSGNRYNLISSLATCIHFISFSGIIDLEMTEYYVE